MQDGMQIHVTQKMETCVHNKRKAKAIDRVIKQVDPQFFPGICDWDEGNHPC